MPDVPTRTRTATSWLARPRSVLARPTSSRPREMRASKAAACVSPRSCSMTSTWPDKSTRPWDRASCARTSRGTPATQSDSSGSPERGASGSGTTRTHGPCRDCGRPRVWSPTEERLGELDQLLRRRLHGEVSLAELIGVGLQLMQARRRAQERGRHGNGRRSPSEPEVRARDERLEVSALLGDDDAAVAHCLKDPYPLERPGRPAVQIEQDLAAGQMLVLV